MKKIILGALAVGIATQAFAALTPKRTDAEAAKVWPQLADCQICRQVVIDIEPHYIERCNREISDAEALAVLAQPSARKMQDIRTLDRHLKLRGETLNKDEKIRYMSYVRQFHCASREQGAEATLSTSPKPIE